MQHCEGAYGSDTFTLKAFHSDSGIIFILIISFIAGFQLIDAFLGNFRYSFPMSANIFEDKIDLSKTEQIVYVLKKI